MNTLLKNYCLSLGFDKIQSLEDITQLIQAHLSTFSFSSAKVLLQDEINLDIESIYESVVIKKRGGYCFEHNKLFYEVLKACGFDVEFYLARVVNNSTNEVPQTHRFTLLNFEGERYLIDVGIGFRSPTVPIAFDKSTTTNLGITYQIQKDENNRYALQIVNKNDIFTVTNFDLNPCFEADFEMGHFYSHKHPCAVFVNNLVVSLITNNEIRSLRNTEYFKIYKNGEEKITINNFEQFKTIMLVDLNLNFSQEELIFLYQNFVNAK